MRREVVQTTIPSGQSLSGVVPVDRGAIVGIIMPAGWDAASITFAVGDLASPQNFVKAQDDAGTEIAITAPAASTYVSIRPTTHIRAPGNVKIRSGTNAVAVAQTANRVLGIVIQIEDESGRKA